MNRLALGAVLLTAACSNHKAFDSLCTDSAPPAACNTTCSPASAATDCPIGYYCAANGKCDAQCTPTGNECGAGNTCTTDGMCQPGNGQPTAQVDANCPAVHFMATKVTPSIQLLLDRSGSMTNDFNDNPTNNTARQKFTIEDNALVGTNGIIPQLQAAVYFGVSMFPSDQCPGVFQTPRALMNAGAIASFIQSNPPDDGDTPTPSAIDSVVQDFAMNPPPAGSPPIIVLATDGLPNDCSGGNGDQAQIDTVTAATNAFGKGIKLFLLSVGNQIDPNFQQALANAGQGVKPGQPDAKAYTANNADELTQAFQDIIGGVVSCDLKLNGHVDSGNAPTGSVLLNGTPLTYGTDWTLDADGQTIHLLGKACDTLKGSTDPHIDATFSCGAVLL